MSSSNLLPISSYLAKAAVGPLSSAIGFNISHEIDHNIFTKKKVKPKIGLRIAEVNLQTATYGRMIPIVYGTVKLAGNIIWASEICEHRHDQYKRIGKFRGKSHIGSSFSYTISLAIAICEGEINEILRVWADDKLIDPRRGNYRFYSGSQTQMPDHLIEAQLGIGSTPAFRGLCYVVIENLSLNDFGNKIPNFVFEVKRIIKSQNSQGEEPLEERIKSMVIIPGSGEFVYDTQVQYKVPIDSRNFREYKTRINQNNRENKADALVSLKQLKDTCPNLEWVAPVVNWFTSSLDVSSAAIMPGVEYISSTTTPDVWAVAGYNRDSAHQITKNKFSAPIYGGTPSDLSVLRYLDAVRAYGYKIMFYPMLLVDRADKPWRGRISGAAKDIEKFFKNYTKFILHYATLTQGKIDAFLIGSEMIGLTKVKDENNNFPAVDALINLAKQVKQILGRGVKISYAADWSEYHHTDGGWYNLDKLWACEYIDFVAIDAYFPLTNEVNSFYDENKIIKGWRSGEGYDFYYQDAQRKIKKDLAKEYAWKNIEHWWGSPHINPDGKKTSWQPKQKKIWFTEVGFPSVDLATNQPNVFYSPGSVESKFPIYSRGKIDFVAQRQALSATEKAWRNSEAVEQLFIWAWDARPFPYWPGLINVWRDGNCWSRGHWVNGKLGLTKLEAIIQDLYKRVGIENSKVRAEELYDFVDGIILYNQETVKDIIELLKTAYFFDSHEENDKLYFVKRRKDREVIKICQNELVISDEAKRFELKLDYAALKNKYKAVYVHYLNYYMDYSASVEYAENFIQNNNSNIFNINFPIVLSPEVAKNIANVALQEKLLDEKIYSFALTSRYLSVKPNDVINLSADNNHVNLRVIESKLENTKINVISAIEVNNQIYDSNFSSNIIHENETILLSKEHFDPGQTTLLILKLPELPFEIGQLGVYLGVFSDEEHWRGAFVECPDSSVLIFENKINLGVVLKDEGDSLEIKMMSGELYNFSNNDINIYQNIACIGEEIIQFKTAKLLEENLYLLIKCNQRNVWL